MQINRENYEIFLIDYLDGKLNKAQMQIVEAFLLANPDIAMEFETLQTFTPVNEAITFDQKDQLLKIPYAKAHADDDFFTQKCIEKIEGILPLSEEPVFEKMVQAKPEAFQSYSLFRKTRLPLEHFNYDEKIVIKVDESNPILDNTNFAGYAIAYHEGWLNQKAQAEIDRYREKHPEAQNIFETIQKLKLIPDNQIQFPGKGALKKPLTIGEQFRKRIVYWGSVAAVLAVGAFAFYMSDNEHSHIEQSMVTAETVHKSTQKQPEAIIPEQPVKSLIKAPILSQTIQKKNLVYQVKNKPSEETLVLIPSENQLTTVKSIPFAGFHQNKTDQPMEFKLDSKWKENEQALLALQLHENNSEQSADKAASDKLIKKAVRYSVNKLIAASHGHIRIQQKEDEKKTKIEVDTRFFAFSTTTKQINF